jgi:hypothetical protein
MSQLTELTLMFLAAVGEQAKATIRFRAGNPGNEDGGYAGTLGLCNNCFGLIRENEAGELVHVSGIVGCADAIRAFVEKGADW